MSCSCITTACHHSHLYHCRGGVTPTLPKEGIVTCKSSCTPNVPPTFSYLELCCWVGLIPPQILVLLLQLSYNCCDDARGVGNSESGVGMIFVVVVVVEESQGPFTSWGTSQPMTPWRPLLGGCTLASFIDDVARRLNGGHVAATWKFSVHVTGFFSWKLGGSPNWLSNESKKVHTTVPYTICKSQHTLFISQMQRTANSTLPTPEM